MKTRLDEKPSSKIESANSNINIFPQGDFDTHNQSLCALHLSSLICQRFMAQSGIYRIEPDSRSWYLLR